MTLLSFSDLVIGFTLLLNSVAVLNFNIVPSTSTEGSPASTVKETLKQFASDIQALRVFIAVWNFIVLFLMIVFFSS